MILRTNQSNRKPLKDDLLSSSPLSSKKDNGLTDSTEKQPKANFSKPSESESKISNDPTATPSAIKYVKRSDVEQKLLEKFDREVLTSGEAMKKLGNLRAETQEKYLYQIRRYIRYCANKGLDNFYVTNGLAKELIQEEISKRGQISENTIKSIRSPLNKLYHINRIVYKGQPKELLGDELISELISSYSNTDKPKKKKGQLDCQRKQMEPEMTPTKIPIIKIGDVSKKKVLTENEVYLLEKFDRDILKSEKTRDILKHLTGKTFKAYSTDIKRFIKFCGRKGLDNFFLNDKLLKEFFQYEVEANSGLAITRLKNIRSSLLKLHQLNSVAYGVKSEEITVISLLNDFILYSEAVNRSNGEGSSNEGYKQKNDLKKEDYDQMSQKKTRLYSHLDKYKKQYDPKEMFDNEIRLLTELERVLKGSGVSVLDGILEDSKRLDVEDIRKYVLFCARKGHSDFFVTGELLKEYFETEIIESTPDITRKSLKEILNRLNRLHYLNTKAYENQPDSVPQMEVIEDFISRYEGKGTSSWRHSSDKFFRELINNTGSKNFIFDQLTKCCEKSTEFKDEDTQRKPSSDEFEQRRKQEERKPHEAIAVPSVQTAKRNEGVSPTREYTSSEKRPLNLVESNILDKQAGMKKKRISPPKMNPHITTVTQVVQEWALFQDHKRQRVSDWFGTEDDLKLYSERKYIINLVEELAFNESYEDKFSIAGIFDEFMSAKKLDLEGLARKIQVYPTHSKREFLRILSRRKRY